jgi:hypothetical protein
MSLVKDASDSTRVLKHNNALARFHSAWRLPSEVIWLGRCLHKMHEVNAQEGEGSVRPPVHLYFISENTENISIKFGTGGQWRS